MPDFPNISRCFEVRPLLTPFVPEMGILEGKTGVQAGASGRDARHMRLLYAAATQQRPWQKFLARRLNSNWRLFQKYAPLLDGSAQRFSRPSCLHFLVDPSSPRSFQFNSLDATFRSYYAPKRDFGHTHEPEVWLLLKLLLVDAAAHHPVFHYIGANWGVHGFIVAQWPGFAGHIHAFEANPQVADLATDICQQLQLTDKITIHAHGLSHQHTTARMGGFGRTGDSSTGRVSHNGTLEIQLKPLDDLTLAAPTVMKLDVENHEHAVLQGAASTIKTHRPYILLESWGTRIDPTIDTSFPALQWLLANNYILYNTTWQAQTPTSGMLGLAPLTLAARQAIPAMLNLLAVPQEKAAAFQTHFLHAEMTV